MVEAEAPRELSPPSVGFWRIGRGDDPLRQPKREVMDMGDSRAGNRFDTVTGQYTVLYFGSTLEGCFGETLNRYRKDPKLAFIDDEWSDLGFMPRGSVPRDWRERRTAVRVIPQGGLPFFNVEHPRNLALLQRELGASLAMLNVTDLDVAVIRGPDRRVTRFISQWVWQQEDEAGHARFAGLRYLSRTNTAWECWAVFNDIPLVEEARQPILATDKDVRRVAGLFDLTVH
ncbi:MAG TPA: RES family NAD+ phosphorylase [Egibacteraceae bacterium]|jgi:hypothetical protein|nr:RES family NAD+ phosphorylase [Egibacteraceae bacterium]